MEILSDFVPTSEAARLLGVSSQHVRWLIRRRRITDVLWTPLGRLILRSAVHRLAAERAAAATQPRGRGRPAGRVTS